MRQIALALGFFHAALQVGAASAFQHALPCRAPCAHHAACTLLTAMPKSSTRSPAALARHRSVRSLVWATFPARARGWAGTCEGCCCAGIAAGHAPPPPPPPPLMVRMGPPPPPPPGPTPSLLATCCAAASWLQTTWSRGGGCHGRTCATYLGRSCMVSAFFWGGGEGGGVQVEGVRGIGVAAHGCSGGSFWALGEPPCPPPPLPPSTCQRCPPLTLPTHPPWCLGFKPTKPIITTPCRWSHRGGARPASGVCLPGPPVP